MTPRVALLMSGHLRSYNEAYASIKKFILDMYNPDVFIHTYNSPGYWTPDDNLELDNKHLDYTKEDFHHLKMLYAPIKLQIETLTPELQKSYRDEANKLFEKYGTKKRWGRNGNIIAMFHNLKKCYNLMKDYEQSKNIKYDFIIRIRPDLVINSISTIFYLDNDLYLAEKEEKEFYEDVLFAGKRDSMDKILNLYDYIEELYKQENNLLDPHDLIKSCVKHFNLKFVTFKLDRLIYNTPNGYCKV